MNIQQEREYNLSESNTAQKQLIDILEGLQPTITELNINIPLSGDIDLSILSAMGFNNIKTINLSEGKLTTINHIPNTVKVLNCSKNLLITLKLPNQLIKLNCSKNHINYIDLTELYGLLILHCENNELTELENIPEIIQEIYCDYNNISRLDLDNLDSLKILHCSHNKIMIMQNLPAQLVDLKMDNNPMAEIVQTPTVVSDDAEIRVDYIEGLNEYFRLKSKYEKSISDKKHSAYNQAKTKKLGKQRAAAVKPLCVNCKRPVGTIFTRDDVIYSAKCGDIESPCNLNIKIMNGFFMNLETVVYLQKQELNESKDAIITQKLDTIFNYLSEASSARLFKKELENYTQSGEMYKTLHDNYELLHNNMHKRELIERKNAEIYELLENIKLMLNEYTKTRNEEILKTAVQLQKDELIPKIEFLRRLKFEIMEMVSDKNEVLHLVQKENSLSKHDFTYSEPGHVMKYNK